MTKFSLFRLQTLLVFRSALPICLPIPMFGCLRFLRWRNLHSIISTFIREKWEKLLWPVVCMELLKVNDLDEWASLSLFAKLLVASSWRSTWIYRGFNCSWAWYLGQMKKVWAAWFVHFQDESQLLESSSHVYRVYLTLPSYTPLPLITFRSRVRSQC